MKGYRFNGDFLEEIPPPMKDRVARSIQEAITHGIEDAVGGQEGGYENSTVVLHLRNFLSQRFGVYTLHQNPVVAEAAQDLWRSIFPDVQQQSLGKGDDTK